MRIEKFLKTSPLFSLYAASSAVLGDFQERLAVYDIHFIQGLILTAVFFEERPVRPSELARTLQVPKSNISHSIRGLERKKWIQRTTHDTDARAYLISLTRSGRTQALRMIRVFDSVQNQIEEAGGDRLNGVLKDFIQIYRRCHFPKS